MEVQLVIYFSVIILGAFVFFFFYHNRKRREWQERTEALNGEIHQHELIEVQYRAQLESKERELLSERDRQELRLREQEESFTRQAKGMEDRFRVLSEEITRRRSEELTSTNREAIDALLKPLNERIESMNRALDESKQNSAEQSGKLHQAIRTLMERAGEVGDKADTLSQALRGKSKMQGDWGEAKLVSLLEAEELVRGVQYTVQENLKDESGRNLRPDVVIYYPDHKALVVDSKVSLTAYADYYNSDDEVERENRKAAHLASINQHIRELAGKNYARYVEKPYQALEYVVMFVPINGALQLAVEAEPTLWRDAMNKGVFIATESTIMAVLRMVSLAWRQYDTDRNMEEITKHGEYMVERVANFCHDFEGLGSRIQQLQRAYEDADRRLRGQQGILTSAKKLEQLGLKNNSKKPLPTPFDGHVEALTNTEE